jgi:3-deoxy-D-manno-octulosonic acid kinase
MTPVASAEAGLVLQPPPAPVRWSGGDVLAQDVVREDLLAILHDHGSVYDWAARMPQPRALRGRAPVFVASLPHSGHTVVVRHAWHGGLLAPLTGDRFLRPTRAPREMQIAAALLACGIPTADICGAVRYAAGAGLVRVDVVSHYLEDSVDLGTVLAGLAPLYPREQALAATSTLLRQLALRGMVHPDLNVKNILLRPLSGPTSSAAALEALVIDVDVLVWEAAWVGEVAMQRNLARLLRSMRKWRRQFGCDIADDAMAAFAASSLTRLRSSS